MLCVGFKRNITIYSKWKLYRCISVFPQGIVVIVFSRDVIIMFSISTLCCGVGGGVIWINTFNVIMIITLEECLYNYRPLKPCFGMFQLYETSARTFVSSQCTRVFGSEGGHGSRQRDLRIYISYLCVAPMLEEN